MPCYYSKIRYRSKPELFEPSTSIFAKYGSFIKQSPNSDRVIKILKSQFGHHKKVEIRNQAQKLLEEHDNVDDYRDMLEFCPPDISIIQNFLYDVWLFNKVQEGEDEPLAIFMPKLCHRIASAIKIQSVYRGYKFRKQLKTKNAPSFNDQIVERRAVIFIQRCWQWYKIRQRLAAINDIKAYIDKIDTNVLYLEQHLYQLKFQEPFIEFDFNTQHEV